MVGGMIPDPFRRCRVILLPGTTAREGLVQYEATSFDITESEIVASFAGSSPSKRT